MILKYNLTGDKRKQLVGAVSKELNTPTSYLGVPSFSYEIGDYTVDKNGTVTGPDNLDLEDALHRAGFDADEREYDEPDTYESGLGGLGAVDDCLDIDQHHPGRYANPNAPITEAMQRQLDELPDFEDLQMDGNEELGLGRTRRENFQGENGMQASDVPQPDSLTIEMPIATFTVSHINNLQRLVASKANMFEKAFGVENIEVEFDEDKVRFPWFDGADDAEKVAAYTHFVTVLCDYTKNKKTKSIEPKQIENYKYAMRTFLLRLGFIGPEFKGMRKILLSKLEGSSAYVKGCGGHHE